MKTAIRTGEDELERVYIEVASLRMALHHKRCTGQGVDTPEARISLARRVRVLEDDVEVSLAWVYDTLKLVEALRDRVYAGCELDYQADLASYVSKL